MLEVVNSLLSVPGALVALDDVARRLREAEPTDNGARETELERLTHVLTEVRIHLRRFAELGPEMQAWKDAHHVTGLVMMQCEDTFRLVAQGRSTFSSISEGRWKRMRNEINTMRSHSTGSITFIQGHPKPEILGHVTLPPEFNGAPRWDEHIVGLEQTCRRCLDEGQRGDLYEVLVELKNFVTALNYRADAHLKEGLGVLTDKIDEFRTALEDPDAGCVQ